MTTFHEAQLRPDESTVLLRTVMNMLWQQSQDEGCCPSCCGPCSVLHALLVTERLDVLLSYPEPDEVWWDAEEHQVDRGFLARAWRLTGCHV